MVEVKKEEFIKVGALGKIKFQKGFYAYVGSALNNLEKRVQRHLRKKKKIHWHIDYLLRKAKVREVIYASGEKRKECTIAKSLAKNFSGIKNFGSSDCHCTSHLFFSENFKTLKKEVKKSFQKIYSFDVISNSHQGSPIPLHFVSKQVISLPKIRWADPANMPANW